MEVSGQHFVPGAWNLGRNPLDIEKVAGWASEEAWTCWRRNKSVSIATIWTPDRPARSPVTTDYAVAAWAEMFILLMEKFLLLKKKSIYFQ